MILVLVGQLPSGKNQIKISFRGGKIHKYPDARFVAWREDALKQIAAQRGTKPTAAMPVHLCVEYVPGDRRVRDVSGMLDAVFHVLAKAKIIDDDGLVWSVEWKRMAINKTNPGAVLTITERKELA